MDRGILKGMTVILTRYFLVCCGGGSGHILRFAWRLNIKITALKQ